jgi:hypothetical protein
MTSTMTTKKKTTTSEKPIETLPPNPFIFEILDLASKQRSNAKKIEVLKTYEHDSLKTILIWNFDETVISLLPEGDVPYGDLKDQNVYSGNLSDNLIREANGGEAATMQDLEGRGRTSLRREYQNLYHFVKGGNHNLSTTRREMMFINMLQGLHSKESEVLCLVKDKKLQTKYKISLENVKESYPDIVWGGRS